MNNFKYALSLANTLFGVEGNPSYLEEIGLIAWNLIGNKPSRLYTYSSELNKEDNSIILPCNVVSIEAVTYNYEDWKYATNKQPNGDYNSQFIENYVETRKVYTHPLYASGKLAYYEHVGDKLYFKKDYGAVNILYHGIILDEDGLPEVSDSEALAIATYLGYTKLYKESIVTRNGNSLQLAQVIQADWLKRCDAARVPDYISQNDMDQVLNAKHNWDRKIFNKSFKPIK